MTVRVLTYNIHGWRDAHGQCDVPRLARIIRDADADIVALNEVFHPFAPDDQALPALQRLADAVAMQWAFGVALTPRFAFAPLAAYGNAVLTRYPLLAHAGHHLPAAEGHEQRGLLEARVLLPDGKRTLSLYVTHLDQHSEAMRMKQVAALLQWTVRDRARPHLLLGDFNALAPADFAADPAALAALAIQPELQRLTAEGLQVVQRLLQRGYTDAHVAAGVPEPTFPAAAPQVRIDYIWLSASLAPALRRCQRYSSVDTTAASDHLPLLAELDENAWL